MGASTAEGPADTTMMGIVHSAVRRDLRRAGLVLADPDLTSARATAVAGHLTWLMDFLHEHHAGEDTGLFPMVREKDPGLAPILDAVDAEHAKIQPAMAEVEARAVDVAVDAAAVPHLAAAVDQLGDVLLPHLRHEEEETMPLVARTLTQREWHEWDQAANVKSRSARDLAFAGHWLLDGTTDADRDVIVHEVPAVVRFVLVHLMGGAYRRRRAQLWEGTAASSVPSLSLSTPA